MKHGREMVGFTVLSCSTEDGLKLQDLTPTCKTLSQEGYVFDSGTLESSGFFSIFFHVVRLECSSTMKTLILVSTFALLFTGCIQQIAVSTVGSIVDDGFDALSEEQDLEFAGQALPANLKLLEVMQKNDPDDKRLLRLLGEGYNSYALGFIEDVDVERARVFYLRARDYALRILRQDKHMAAALDGPLDALKTELNRLDKDDVPGVFWAAFGWGSYINLSLTDPNALADLPRAQAMMEWVAKTDSSFYYGGAHVFLGTLYGTRPKLLGGDAELSKKHFEKALAINGGKFLMTYVFYARSYAVQTMDETLFEELLTTVQNASLEILPKFRLANAIAKRKAALLLAKKSELF